MLRQRKENNDESPDVVSFVEFLTKGKNFFANIIFFRFVTEGQKPEISNKLVSIENPNTGQFSVCCSNGLPFEYRTIQGWDYFQPFEY